MSFENSFYPLFSKRGNASTGLAAGMAWGEGDEAAHVVYSPEIGERVTTAEAIRERVRLHPYARTNEILAMFELDGNRVSPDLVRRIKREELGDLA
jgi:hypothetical protein